MTERKQSSLRGRQRAERELLILAEAERILHVEGYDGLVMEHLAARVGVSKGTLYQHFAKKEDLVGAIMVRAVSQVGEQLMLLVADTDRPAAERLSDALSLASNERSRGLMATLTAPQKQTLAVALGHYPGLQDTFAHVFEGLCTLISQGQASGAFDPTIPAPFAAVFLMSLARAQDGPVQAVLTTLSVEEFVALGSRLFLNGLCVRPAP